MGLPSHINRTSQTRCLAPARLPLFITAAALTMALAACEQRLTGDCYDALDRLDSCMTQQCDGDEALGCGTYFAGSESGSLFHHVSDRCDSLSTADIDHLLNTSCTELAEEALLAVGKADQQCLPYFPWCNELPAGEDGYTVNILEQTDSSIKLELLIHDVTYTTSKHEVGHITGTPGEIEFHTIDVQNSGHLPQVGRPNLPSLGLMLGVPPQTDTAWVETLEQMDGILVRNMNLIPVQAPQLEASDQPPFAYDAAYYAQDIWYPEGQEDLDSPKNLNTAALATWRNHKVVRINLLPARFNPGLKQLEVARRMVVTIGYANLVNEQETIKQGEATFAPTYDRAIANYYEMADARELEVTPPPVRYLAVVHDPLLAAVQPLLDLKEAEGLPVEVIKLSTIEGRSWDKLEKIKAAIMQRYDKYGIEYVLLVGDEEDLPLKHWVDEPSDAWYGCLKGDDPLPEVAVGRISGKTPEEVALHVAKILNHDTQGDEQWRRRVLLVAHEQDAPRKYTGCLDSIRRRRYQAPAVEFIQLYGADGATNEQLREQVNQGVGIINYRGHGTETNWHEWNGENFDLLETPLENGDRLPVVFSVACLNMAIDGSEQTLAEQWVQHPTGGAVAFLGSTRPSYTTPNHDFDRHLFRAVLGQRSTAIGQLLIQANAKLYRQYGADEAALANMRMYAWLGDPALKLGKAFYYLPPLTPNGVIINEVLADPAAGIAGDANGDGVRQFDGDEFVEIINSNDTVEDISGWTISDRLETRFTFPEGTRLEPGQAAVVFGGGDTARIRELPGVLVFAAPSKLKLNNNGDIITLANKFKTPVDRLDYLPALGNKDRSMVRATDSDPRSNFVQHPGDPLFSPGTQSDGSLFYSPELSTAGD